MFTTHGNESIPSEQQRRIVWMSGQQLNKHTDQHQLGRNNKKNEQEQQQSGM